MTYRAAVALGSNLGDRLATLREAAESVGALGAGATSSSLYQTAPVGGPDQGPYLNAVVVVDTDLGPHALLAALQAIETAAGRVRSERWGPRTLDLDIVTMTDDAGAAVVVDTEDLQVPHPRAGQRRFVLEPLAEVWPDAPVGPEPVQKVLASVAAQDVELLGRNWRSTPHWVSPALVAIQGVALLVFATVAIATGRLSAVGWRTGAGGVLAAAGLALALWAAASLGSALTPLPEPRVGTVLVDSGPYRWVRHPIYAGVALALVGASILVGSWPALGVGLATGVLLWFKAGYEERRLGVLVPGYPGYRRRVPGRLFPWRRGHQQNPRGNERAGTWP